MDIYELVAKLRKLKMVLYGIGTHAPVNFAIVGWFGLKKSIKVIAPAEARSLVFGTTTAETVTAGYISLKGNKIYVKYSWIAGAAALMEEIAQWIVENTDLVRGN